MSILDRSEKYIRWWLPSFMMSESSPKSLLPRIGCPKFLLADDHNLETCLKSLVMILDSGFLGVTGLKNVESRLTLR